MKTSVTFFLRINVYAKTRLPEEKTAGQSDRFPFRNRRTGSKFAGHVRRTDDFREVCMFIADLKTVYDFVTIKLNRAYVKCL